MADAVAILASKYTLLPTNVPFLGSGDQCSTLAAFSERSYPAAQSCLSTTMLQRMFKLASPGASVVTVTKQEWCFLVSYANFRRDLLRHFQLDFLATLGEEAWVTFNKRGPLATLTSWTSTGPNETCMHFTIEATQLNTIKAKQQHLISSEPNLVWQSQQAKNPDGRIMTIPSAAAKLLSHYAHAHQGISTGDVNRLERKFWELPRIPPHWRLFRGTVSGDVHFSGCEHVVYWGDAGSHFAALRGSNCFGKRGVAVSQMRHLPVSLYLGEPFDGNVSALVPFNAKHLPAIWAYCSSPDYRTELRKIDKKKNITNATLVKVPFDLERWQAVAAKNNPADLPEPHSDEPDQWLFHGHCCRTVPGVALHVAFARLSGYRWPAEINTAVRLSTQAREWIKSAKALPDPDADGLLAIPSVEGAPALVDRLRRYLAAAFGPEWSDAMERRLVAEADEVLDNKLARDTSLETWLRERAFRQHCTLFHQRPFLWHIWDGLKDGFSVFVQYHRFDQAALRKLTYTVLGDWLARAKAEKNDLRFEKARELQQKLEKILEGEVPYDIFVRWKPLAEQSLGWNPDLEDGVRLNIRPFVLAGVLREIPDIKWSTDGGTDTPGSPWYALGAQYGGKEGDRVNDHHTTLTEKRAAHTPGKRAAGNKS
jgi:hypothetical protein